MFTGGTGFDPWPYCVETVSTQVACSQVFADIEAGMAASKRCGCVAAAAKACSKMSSSG